MIDEVVIDYGVEEMVIYRVVDMRILVIVAPAVGRLDHESLYQLLHAPSSPIRQKVNII